MIDRDRDERVREESVDGAMMKDDGMVMQTKKDDPLPERYCRDLTDEVGRDAGW
jgi:hypothetical protein